MQRSIAEPSLNGAYLAERLGMSRMHLYRHIKRYYGCSTGQYVARKRLQMARRLLRNNPLPIKEIAASVGFRDPAYFSRVFKRHYGFTPREAREMEEE